MEPLNWTGPSTDALMTVVDEELDRYRLLAYLQRIELRYRERKLYPHLDELRVRSEQLTELRRRKDELALAMPRSVLGLDPSAGELIRAVPVEDDLLRVIDSMIDKALPELNNALGRGAELREQLAGHIRCEPVGVLPLRTDEGYLLMHEGRRTRAYAYALTMLGPHPGRFANWSVRTRYLADYAVEITGTFERIKADLVRKFAHLPCPAVFAFTSDVSLPAIETFVPLAKQLVYEVITSNPAQGTA